MKLIHRSIAVLAGLLLLDGISLSKAQAQTEQASELFKQGLEDLSDGEYSSADKRFTQVIESLPEPQFSQPSAPYVNRGIARQNLSDLGADAPPSGALGDYRLATRTKPSNGLSYLNRGILYFQEGKISLVQNVIAQMRDPSKFKGSITDSAYAYVHAAIVLFEQQKLDQDLTSPQLIKEIDGYLSAAYKIRADIHRLEGRNGEAIENYTQAISLDNQNGHAYLNRGVTYSSGKEPTVEQLGLADEDFRVARSLLPFSLRAQALNNLGSINLLIYQYQAQEGLQERDAEKQLIEASDFFDAAISLENNEPEFYYNLGLASQLQGNWVAAKANFEMASDLYLSEGNTLMVEQINDKLDKLDDSVISFQRKQGSKENI